MWMDSSFVIYKWGICYWNKQWTVNDIANFEDLILKLGWMFWTIIIMSIFGMSGL